MSELARRGRQPSDGGQGKPRRRPNIDDVARLAGVSRQTVSNVLNGRSAYFSADTLAKVTAAMDELAYQPNRAAQTLRSQRSMQIGYHMSGEELEIVKGFTLSFLQALIKAAAQQGYQIVVFTHNGDDPRPVFRELIARRNVDAVIVSESRVDDPRVRLLAETGLPFASFGRLAPELPQQWVDIDNAAGMITLVDYLVDAGYRRYAYIGAEGSDYWKLERLQGFRSGLAQHSIAIDEQDVFHGSDSQIRERIRHLLTAPSRPDAIVTSSDSVAAVAVNVCHALGLQVGRDIAITGFDGGAMGLLTEPTVTSVRIPVERIAGELIARCQQEIENGPTGRPGLLVPTEIVRGGSA
jgi:DNA-binding LacI/PurR family transcriptional regulator